MTEYIDITIRRNATGEVRVRRWTKKMGIPSNIDYVFGEGNWACDCNRRLEFERAKGPCNEDYDCGNEDYDVLSIVDDQGNLLYQDKP